jgi:hypothetical protein
MPVILEGATTLSRLRSSWHTAGTDVVSEWPAMFKWNTEYLCSALGEFKLNAGPSMKRGATVR